MLFGPLDVPLRKPIAPGGYSTIVLSYPHYLYLLQAVPVSSVDDEGDNALSDMDERQQLRLMLLVSVFFLGGGN